MGPSPVELPGTDTVMQAYSGFMSINKDATGMPAADIYVVDLTGLHLYGAVTTALYSRQASGGCHVETSLAEAMGLSSYKMVEHHLQGEEAEIIGTPVGTFQTADGYEYQCAEGYAVPWLLQVAEREEWLEDPDFNL